MAVIHPGWSDNSQRPGHLAYPIPCGDNAAVTHFGFPNLFANSDGHFLLPGDHPAPEGKFGQVDAKHSGLLEPSYAFSRLMIPFSGDGSEAIYVSDASSEEGDTGIKTVELKLWRLPATAESGKTTLTATLVARGYRLFSDEVTSLDYEGQAHPLPFCMNIKEGSWPVLAADYPELQNRETHKRFDGQNIRFLPPKNMHTGRQKASHIVFPRYTPGAATTLTPLSAKEALARIKDASYQVQYNMDERKFEKILQNLIALPKYELLYSDRDEAVRAIDGLIRDEV